MRGVRLEHRSFQWASVLFAAAILACSSEPDRAKDRPAVPAIAAAAEPPNSERPAPASRPSGLPSAYQNLEGEQRTPVESSSALPKIELPAFTPDPPSQLLVCGKWGFGRLGASNFEYFSNNGYHLVANLPMPNPTAALALAGDGALLFTREHVFRYYRGETRAVSFARIPLLGPAQLWPDPTDIDGFWVRYLRDPDLHHFRLAPDRVSVTISETRALPDQDVERFTLLPNNVPLYVTANEVVYGVAEHQRRMPVARFGEAVVGLLRDRRMDRFWVIAVKGERSLAHLVELSAGLPIRTSVELAGTPLGFASGRVLASVSVSRATPRVHWLEVFDGGQRVQRFELPELDTPHVADGSAPSEVNNRGVCLIPDRPWVLVGGRDLLQLFDYRKGKVLFERF